MQVEMHCRLEHTLEYRKGLPREAVAREPVSDQRIVVRPDAAVVISHRIVMRLALCDRPYPPSGKAARREKRLDYAAGVVRSRNRCQEALSGVRRPNLAGPVAAVERE